MCLVPKPKKAGDVLNVGDLIWVRNTKEQSYRLSQIPLAQAAFVAMNPKSGAIFSLIGGFNFYYSRFNRATQAYRQVGSVIKPFIYSAALAQGMTAATLINDAPIVFHDNIENSNDVGVLIIAIVFLVVQFVYGKHYTNLEI